MEIMYLLRASGLFLAVAGFLHASTAVAAYSLFQPPRLSITFRSNLLEISWAAPQGYVEFSGSGRGGWQTLTNRPIYANGKSTLTLPSPSTPQFYRVRQNVFRAMSYNIHHGANPDDVLNLAQIASVINAQSPDLVGLQEVDKNTTRSGFVNQAAELGRLTGMYYAFGKNINYQTGEYGLAVLSKYPIKSAKHVLYSRQDTSLEQRGLTTVQVTIENADIFLLNTHLDASTTDTERLYEVSQLKTIVQSYPAERVLCCGDFNFTPSASCYTEMTTAFADAWPGASTSAGFTFPSALPTRRIDYFWTKMLDIRPVSGRVPSTQASDHSPLVMEFLLPRPN